MSDSKYRGGLTWMVKKQYRLTHKEFFLVEFYMWVFPKIGVGPKMDGL